MLLSLGTVVINYYFYLAMYMKTARPQMQKSGQLKMSAKGYRLVAVLIWVILFAITYLTNIICLLQSFIY